MHGKYGPGLCFSRTLWLVGQFAQHDERGMYAEFERPRLLHPGYVLGSGARLPERTGPEDPLERLLWNRH